MLHRVLVSTEVTLSHTFMANDAPVNPDSGGVTATVARLDGTPVTSVAATPGATGVFSFALPDVDDLDAYTLDWSGIFGGGSVTIRDYVEVVGGYLFGIDQARHYGSNLSTTTWPTPTLMDRRTSIEVQAERIAGVAFVPRFARIRLTGSDDSSLFLGVRHLRRVRKVTYNGVTWPQAAVDAIPPSVSGVAELDGGTWPCWPRQGLIIELEHGMDYPPQDASEAGIVHMRSRLDLPSQNVPYRAISFQAGDGGFYRISQPTAERTGIPEVDAAYLGAGIDVGGFA